MRRTRGRARKRLAALAALILILATATTIWRRLQPTLREIVRICVSNRASQAINDAVQSLLASDAENTENLVVVQRDTKGNVTAVETNIAKTNRLRAMVLDAVDTEIHEISASELGVPIGNVLLPALFSGRGPMLPVRILAISSSDATFESSFSAAGINQTRHRIVLNVCITMTVLSPAGMTEITSEAEMIAAETVIVGVVPDTYLSMNERSKSSR